MAENSRRAVALRAERQGYIFGKGETPTSFVLRETPDGPVVRTYIKDKNETAPLFWARLHDEIELLGTAQSPPEPAIPEPVLALAVTGSEDSEAFQAVLDIPLPEGAVPEYVDETPPTPVIGDMKPRPVAASFVAMTSSGYCKWPGVDGHGHAICQRQELKCDCECHE